MPSSAVGRRRLQKEYLALRKNPPQYITARPEETDIYTWHYVLEGPPDSVYENGFYHGVLKFPSDYPYAPPSILMFTKSGRFKTNQRLCLSMSDFHPESWNPMWSVSSILSGLFSFMLEDKPTLGSLETSTATKKTLAARSLSENIKNPTFRRLFPSIAERGASLVREASSKEESPLQQSAQLPLSSSSSPARSVDDPTKGGTFVSTVGVIAASLLLGYFLFV